MLPPTAFLRELKNRLAAYLVAGRRGEDGGTRLGAESATAGTGVIGSTVAGLLHDARDLLRGSEVGLEPERDFVAGFLGTWYMVDEAHIVSIGVRRSHRGRGIGELLLIAAIEQAMDRGAEVVTLEVRPSNMVARNLYGKYHFKERGVRKAYYADNREDALILTTDSIQRPPYPGVFHTLAKQHERHWGQAERVLS
jgi:ribosomal-protein-alanine N-acetyltransferase